MIDKDVKLIDKDVKGVIFNIQKFSLHDGPGIRSIVFFKGCDMSCLWCSNPESQDITPQIVFNKNLCTDCGKCGLICKNEGINKNSKYKLNNKKCITCGECVDACPTGSLVVEGKSVSVEDVVQELKKDSVHYRRSGGGITLSGGEALLQPEFAIELLKKCKSYGWHTAIETALYVKSDDVKKIMKYIDLVMIDIKSIDNKKHKKFTGVDNTLILENIKIADKIAKEIVIRVPVIEGFNGDEKSIEEIGKFVKELKNVKKIDLLPYHNYGENKYEAIGKDYLLKAIKPPSEDKMNKFKELIEKMGLKCSIGAN